MNTILITGANRGLGLEFARSYAGEGWRVHACCRHPEKAKALQQIAGDLTLHKLDVTDGLRVASLARELADEPIDILLNNAGVFHYAAGEFGNIDYDDWVEELKVNTVAPARMAERFVKQVAASERKLIVNISSGMGSIAGTMSGDSIIYRSTKAGLNMVVKCLSQTLASQGITVVALSSPEPRGRTALAVFLLLRMTLLYTLLLPRVTTFNTALPPTTLRMILS